MSKELEALNKIAYFYGYDENIEMMNKSVKALEIIKEKGVDFSLIIQLVKSGNGYESYNNLLKEYQKLHFDLVNRHRKPLTKKEYDLLKELLL